MLNKVRGFTLIELLIVVAILGILAALLVPNITTAVQKAKQKSTMKDVGVIASSIADFVTDNGVAPVANGAYTASSEFYTGICPFYVKVLPISDKWGTFFRVYTGTNANQYGITTAVGDDFLVSSYGKGGEVEGWTFVPASPEAGMYVLSTMAHFERDLVNWNGSWIRGPRTAAAGT
ncbi:MAG: type II secretion system protein [Candidatus Aminicenantes bacterium]|nr:type II secretion system protein [Candidatus Aminicenantes bacterium]